ITPMWQLDRSRLSGTRLVSGHSRRARRSKQKLGPRFEPLEPRLVLSTYYVAPTGSDSNAGTQAKPFKTFQHAMMSLQPGDTLNPEPGTYAGFIVGWDSTPASAGDPYGMLSGTAGKPITIQADPSAPPGSVIINSRDNKTPVGIDLEPGCDYIVLSGLTI